MEWIRRKEWSVGGGSGVGTTESLVKIGKWSDGEQWVMERDGAREVSEEVMIKSRMWLWSWVGMVTCWLRLKEERRQWNWEVRGSFKWGGHLWSMLKSSILTSTSIHPQEVMRSGSTSCYRQKYVGLIRQQRLTSFSASGRYRRTIDVEYRRYR